MKKTLTSLLISGLVLSAVAPAALAADPLNKSANTTGKVTFTVPDEQKPGEKPGGPGGETIKPGYPEGGSTTGPLRIEFAPGLDFGGQTIESGKTSYTYAKWQGYTPLEEDSDGKLTPKVPEPGKAYYMPSFLQVTDERGDNLPFKVTVSASTFTGQKGDTTKTLPNTHIEFTGGTYEITPKKADDAKVDTILAVKEGGFSSDNPFVVTDQAQTILATKEGQTINGKRATLIFANGYDSATWKGIGAEATNHSTALKDEDMGHPEGQPVRQTGVRLKSPASDVKDNGVEYTSTLTWTITDVL